MILVLSIIVCAVCFAWDAHFVRKSLTLTTVFCAVFLAPSGAMAATKTIVIGDAEVDGFKIGMSKTQIDRTRKDVKYGEDINGDGGCIQAEVKNRPFTLMLEKSILTRIYFHKSNYVTSKKIHLGSSEKAAIAAYGKALKVETHHYDELGHYLTLQGKNGMALRFETDGKLINGLSIGTKTAIELVEGCL